MQEDYLIPRLKEKIIDSNARSIYVNAHPRKSINRIDALSIQYLRENLDTQSIVRVYFTTKLLNIVFPSGLLLFQKTEMQDDFFIYYVEIMILKMN